MILDYHVVGWPARVTTSLHDFAAEAEAEAKPEDEGAPHEMPRV